MRGEIEIPKGDEVGRGRGAAALEARQPVYAAAIDASAVYDIVLAWSDLLKELHERLRVRNVRLTSATALGLLRGLPERRGVPATVGGDGLFSRFWRLR